MKYATLTLSGTLRDTAPAIRAALFTGTEYLALDKLRARVESILATDSTERVMIVRKEGFSTGGLARWTALRRLIERLVKAGKEVTYYAAQYDTLDLYLSSAATRRLINPVGRVMLGGIASRSLFVQRLLRRNRISIDVYRHGRYKSAADALTRSDMDPHHREQVEAYLGPIWERILETIAQGMGKERAAVDELAGGLVLSPEEATQGGWIHEASTAHSVLAAWKEEKVRADRPKKWRGRSGKGPKVAVLHLEGAIADGKSRMSGLLGEVVGSDTFVQTVDKVRKSSAYKAVIIRVVSPGGSATGSEDIRSALLRLAKAKPLVVSMGAVAGSGGYWVANLGVPVFAEEDTITGSIGVVVARAGFGRSAARVGVNHDGVHYGALARSQSSLEELDDAGRRAYTKTVGDVYRSFLDLVSSTRSLSRDAVVERAEGRIWSGGAAYAHGLVDEVGDLDSAAARIAEKLGAASVSLVSLPRLKLSFLERMITRSSTAAALAGAIGADGSAGALRRAAASLLPGLSIGFGAEVTLAAAGEWIGRPLVLMPEACQASILGSASSLM